jgi:hypothetical protein
LNVPLTLLSSSVSLFYIRGNIKEYIDSVHELVQILHHAYVYDFNYVLLLVGDATGAILSGTWVELCDDLKGKYGTFLKLVYEKCLRWAYRPDLVPLPEEKLKAALQHVRGVDFESFTGHFALWRYISTKIKGPLPHVERIIPFIFAKWNCLKGGSDTITKLIWFAIKALPVKSPQVRINVWHYFL